ncbi:unnamed protein product [Vicia faba]|uniref:Nodule-specific Glycine Rich Peptide n=1 Tax=Vicia faba TaxID=3906 RepID=A0AAV0YVE9_VICFA|nr:unnamed protein product [Vicia faba]
MTKTKSFILIFFLCAQILFVITIESSKDGNQYGAIEESKRKIGMGGWGGWKVMGRRKNDNGGEKEDGKGEEVHEEGEKDGESGRDEESEKDNENEQSPGGAGSWGWGGNIKNGYGQSGGRPGSWGWGGLFDSKY